MSPIREKKKKNKSRAALFRFSFVFFFSSSLHLHAGVISTASLVMGNDAAVDERVRLGRKIPPSTDRNFHGILATSTVATRRFPFWFGFFFFLQHHKSLQAVPSDFTGFFRSLLGFSNGFSWLFFFCCFVFLPGVCERETVNGGGDRRKKNPKSKKKIK